MKTAAKRIYKKIFPPSCLKYLKKELESCDSVIELGSGFDSPLRYIPIKGQKRTGVELHKPYIKTSKKKGIHDEYLNKDVLKLKLKKNSYDAVIAIDFIEHLKKKEGLKLLNKMDSWAKKKVIIYTPNGFLEQKSVDGNDLQEHLSGWTVKDFEKNGFKVKGIGGIQLLRGDRASIRFSPKIFWRVISDISQKFTYHFPKSAFQLFAVKTKKK